MVAVYFIFLKFFLLRTEAQMDLAPDPRVNFYKAFQIPSTSNPSKPPTSLKHISIYIQFNKLIIDQIVFN